MRRGAITSSSIRQIEPEGIGPLELAFRQTVARLAAEGLFDPARKRPLPRFPRRIVVVTSPTGAAVRDLLQVTGRRWRATRSSSRRPASRAPAPPREVVAATRAGQPRRRGRPHHRRPRRRQPRRPLDVQRGGRRAGDRRVAPAGRLGDRPRGRRHPRRPRRRPPRPDPQRGGRDLRPRRPRGPPRLDRLADRLAHAGRARSDARARLDRLADRARRASAATSTTAATASPGSPPASTRSAPWPSSPAATA